MQSDDVFRRAFDQVSVRLAAWADAQRDAGEVTIETRADYLRLSLEPHAAHACPIEVMVHRSTQAYDIQIGAETWEGIAAGDLAHLEPLLQAVVNGHVLTRRSSATASGVELGTTVIVTAATGSEIRFERASAAGERLTGAASITRDQHWLPYRRD